MVNVVLFRVSNAKRNKRYSICQKPTQERAIAKRFAQDIFPSSVGFGCKGTKKNIHTQTLFHFEFISAAKVLYQTAKTCQYAKKNALFCGKVHFLYFIVQ